MLSLSKHEGRTLWHYPGDAQNVGRARRAEGNAGGDDDALAGLGEAVLERVADRPDDPVAEVPRSLGVDAVPAPADGAPPRRRPVGRPADKTYVPPLPPCPARAAA